MNLMKILGYTLIRGTRKKLTSIEEIDALYNDNPDDLLIPVKDELFLTKQNSASLLIEIFEENLLSVEKGADHTLNLVGLRGKIFNLMKRPSFQNKKFSAVEYTRKGQELTTSGK